jgi:uncharacterized protein involved in type VI secretion and phage assembly
MNEGERSSGVVIGKVTAVKDPTKLGQIQVTYPWLSGPETRWVSVAAPMAGKDRGFFCMPRVDDEVILAFHMGMWDHPIVIGFTWNPVQTPPSPDERLCMWRSENDHTIYLVDSTEVAGNRGALIIKDGHENTIVMTNTHITIKSRGALSLEADGVITIDGRPVKKIGPEI